MLRVGLKHNLRKYLKCNKNLFVIRHLWRNAEKQDTLRPLEDFLFDVLVALTGYFEAGTSLSQNSRKNRLNCFKTTHELKMVLEILELVCFLKSRSYKKFYQ